jgi:cytochrome c-type biogenesis protein CcmH/NrfF
MNIQSFLEHHGIVRNPFAEEDAQTDPVFKEHCISSSYHPIWDKVYGDPAEPSTSIIFGLKGSGKTAMRLQIDRHLQRYNEQFPGQRVFVIRYDDFNPFLDHFSERMSRRVAKKPEKTLDHWRLWDHMDAILCIGVTELVNRIVHPDHVRASEAIDQNKVHALDRTSTRDLLLLAACYDQSTEGSFSDRWNGLRKTLRYTNVSTRWQAPLAIASAIVSCLLVGWLLLRDWGIDEGGQPIKASAAVLWLVPILTLIGSLPWLTRTVACQFAALGIHKHMRVGKRDTSVMRKTLKCIPAKELASQPMPRYDRTDDRYELLNKFQSLLRQFGFRGVIVLMDRVDEPHLTGGKPELMQRFVWPMLDNKLLKHPGVGFKIMLPQELHRDIQRETRDFHERARLDKQNVIPAFHWTGESLYDLARARMLACAADGRTPEPRDLFGDEVSYERLLAAFQSLRVPRHLFRLLYRVLVNHCNRHTDAQPAFKISGETLEAALAAYSQEEV